MTYSKPDGKARGREVFQPGSSRPSLSLTFFLSEMSASSARIRLSGSKVTKGARVWDFEAFRFRVRVAGRWDVWKYSGLAPDGSCSVGAYPGLPGSWRLELKRSNDLPYSKFRASKIQGVLGGASSLVCHSLLSTHATSIRPKHLQLYYRIV